MQKKTPFLIGSLTVFVPALLSAQPAQPTGPLASGLTALAASDYAKAETELAQVKGAQEAEAKLGLARSALEQGKLADADKHAQAALGSAPQKVKATTLRAEVLIAQGKRADAIALLQPIVKGAKGADVRRARLILGEALIDTGKRDDADEPLKKVIEEYNDGSVTNTDAEGLSHVGRAAMLLRSPKDANTAFNESERVDKKRVETLLWRAELFLDKYDPGHAEEVTKEALHLAPKRADALVMLARVKLDQTLDFEDAEKLIKEALAINPKHTGAFAVKAGIHLRDMDIAGAEKAIADGLATNPNDLELLSLKAAARFLDDDPKGFEAQKKDVLSKNPQYAQLYGIAAEYAEWEHRYDDMVTMMKDATKLDPEDGKAWALLGLTQMRSGDEDKGLEAIKKAWTKDKFNVRVFNTLNMYEQQIPTQYDLVNDGVFKVRYHKEERAVMERYVPRMLGEAWGSMKARYGFVPKAPVQVEFYGNREQFSVRTSGLPNIGIQGVCFGKVIASMSPKSESFNWGNVLWHELGHVFAIQLSKNHVPRWFTEGLSEYETIARRPEWQRELDPQLYAALERGTLPSAVDMNRAFTHASNGEEVTVAYYAASQLMIHTVEAYGMPRVVEALKLWGQGVRTPDVIQRAFGVSPKDYDARFRAWAMDRLKRFRGQYVFREPTGDLETAQKAAEKAPNDASAQTTLAFMLIRKGKGKEAKAALDKALSIDPKAKDAHYIYARVAMMEKDPQAADVHLAKIRDAGGDGFAIAMMRAEIARAAKDTSRMRFFLEAAHRFDPNQSEPLSGLVALAEEEKREADLLPLLQKLSIRDQHNPKTWRMLLERLAKAGDWSEVVRVGESAVFIDVHDAKTHLVYGEGLAQKGLHEQARFELESATLGTFRGNDKKETAARAYALLARSEDKLGRKADADKHRAEALKLDPNCKEAKP